ncbi:MAG TPA: hypothetical protein VD967_03340 [Candidatus Paceibacterota bacterium]|nr:hypothetical protein [Candidatus Paceibacterota bacterium]
MEIAPKLFGGERMVKLLRLFLFNPGAAFDGEHIRKRTGVDPRKARRELAALKSIDLLAERTPLRGKREPRLSLNKQFPYADSLRALLRETAPFSDTELKERFTKAGTMKLLVSAGFFVDNPDSRLDLLIVGDKLKRKHLEKAIRELELECARELRYAVLSGADFDYRLNIYDKLVRDVFDYPHRLIVDRFDLGRQIGLSTRRAPLRV